MLRHRTLHMGRRRGLTRAWKGVDGARGQQSVREGRGCPAQSRRKKTKEGGAEGTPLRHAFLFSRRRRISCIVQIQCTALCWACKKEKKAASGCSPFKKSGKAAAGASRMHNRISADKVKMLYKLQAGSVASPLRLPRKAGPFLFRGLGLRASGAWHRQKCGQGSHVLQRKGRI